MGHVKWVQYMTELCRWWADLLGLKDWDVVLSLKTRRDMMKLGHPDSAACVNAWPNVKQAVVSICTDDDLEYKSDMEESLVHEVLHVWLWQFAGEDVISGNDAEVRDLEQALNSLSGALVKLRRASGQGPSPQ